MMRILIIDDEPRARHALSQMLQGIADVVVVGQCSSLQEAKIMVPATLPDLVLLDIILPDGTGFDLLSALPAVTFHVVFCTAFNDFAIRAIKYGALDYLLKPPSQGELEAAIEKARDAPFPERDLLDSLEVAKSFWLNPDIGGDRRIVLKSQRYFQVVSFEEIIYCKSLGNYTHFQLSDNRKVVVSRPLKEFYNELLPHRLFLPTHRSYLVNANYIDRYVYEGYLMLKGGEQIPVSARRRAFILQYFSRT